MQVVEQQPDLHHRFAELAATWKEETGLLSSISKKAMHPAYQRIIGLGPPALPLILNELQREPDHWFWALNAITGEDPAHGEDSFDGAVAGWLQWGRERGYIS